MFKVLPALFVGGIRPNFTMMRRRARAQGALIDRDDKRRASFEHRDRFNGARRTFKQGDVLAMEAPSNRSPANW